jgi:hypothetical protein
LQPPIDSPQAAVKGGDRRGASEPPVKILIAAACVLANTVIASGQQSALARNVIGAGSRECREWTQASHSDLYWTFSSWIMGYVSAFNAYGGGSGDISAPFYSSDLKFGLMFAWIDVYCKNHPAAPLYVAVDAMIATLRKAPERLPLQGRPN